MNKLIIGLIAAVIIVGGGFALTRNSNNSNATKSTQPTTANPSTNSQTVSNTVTYNGNSFSPTHLIVKSGTVVTIKNTSSEDLQFQSDPHPVHTDDPDLNVGVVNPGQSKTFTVTKKGAFGYHDHLNPSEKGTITIE